MVELAGLKNALIDIGFSIKVRNMSKTDAVELPTYISAGMAEYIFRLVDFNSRGHELPRGCSRFFASGCDDKTGQHYEITYAATPLLELC